MNAKLQNAVIKQLGISKNDVDYKSTLEDICHHGVSGGFSGFIYYSETVKFFKQNRREIVELVQDMAESLDEEPIEMVAMFNCLGGRTVRGLDDIRRVKSEAMREYGESVARCLFGGRIKEDDTIVCNALAWFAAEEVARYITEE